MIHYHGSPMGNTIDAARFFAGRHGLVSFYRPDDLAIIAEVCQSFALDNGAFSAWRKGETIDFDKYTEWVELWHRHPGFDWAAIPDVIDGTEKDNDALLDQWPDELSGVPVWHMHESIDRFKELCSRFRAVAIGSSGVWSQPASIGWWKRIHEAMKAVCDDKGRPTAKLHGMRMLDPTIFTQLPLSSADSTNAVVNSGDTKKWGPYRPPSGAQRADVIASRVEAHQSAPTWNEPPQQEMKFQSQRWLKEV